MITLIYGTKNTKNREMSFQKTMLFMNGEICMNDVILIDDVKKVISYYLYLLRKDKYSFRYEDYTGEIYRGLEYYKWNTDKTINSYTSIRLNDGNHFPLNLQRYYDDRMYKADFHIINRSDYECCSIYYGVDVSTIIPLHQLNNILGDIKIVVKNSGGLFAGILLDTISLTNVAEFMEKQYKKYKCSDAITSQTFEKDSSITDILEKIITEFNLKISINSFEMYRVIYS
jgi:hypothetical protein